MKILIQMCIGKFETYDSHLERSFGSIPIISLIKCRKSLTSLKNGIKVL